MEMPQVRMMENGRWLAKAEMRANRARRSFYPDKMNKPAWLLRMSLRVRSQTPGDPGRHHCQLRDGGDAGHDGTGGAAP